MLQEAEFGSFFSCMKSGNSEHSRGSSVAVCSFRICSVRVFKRVFCGSMLIQDLLSQSIQEGLQLKSAQSR